MTKIKPIFQSSLIFLIITSCKKDAIDVELNDITNTVLESFSNEQKSYLDTLTKYKQSVFYLLDISKENNELRFQCYLIENRLDDYVEEFEAHSTFNGYDVVIYGELNPYFYDLKSSKKTSYIHKYGSSKNQIYDPPYWNLYFNQDGKLFKTQPKEVFDILNIDKKKQ